MSSPEFDFDDPHSYHRESPQERLSKEQIEIIAETYERTWQEFYEWEHDYCLSELQSLGNGIDALLESSKNVWVDVEEWDPETGWSHNDVDKQDESKHVKKIVVKTSSAVQIGGAAQVVRSTIQIDKFMVDFPPVPPYVFCKYLDRCVDARESHEKERYDEETDKKTRELWIYFCPFTSKDGRMLEEDRGTLLEASSLHWEELPVRDPDVGIVMIQTVARLRDDSRLQNCPKLYELIDQEGIFPPILPDEEDIGILKRWRCREPLLPAHWGSAHDMPSPIEDANSGDLVLAWCPICLQYDCVSHNNESLSDALGRKGESVPNPMPTIEYPCGEHCALTADEGAIYQWNQDDLDFLKMILVDSNLAEWDKSCNIAAMVAKPCYAVFKQMEHLLSTSDFQYEAINQNRSRKAASKKGSSKIPPKYDYDSWKPHGPCVHQGPCTIDCVCVTSGGWCGPMCRCPAKCPRRPPGCDCRNGCQTNAGCRCRRANRECQPGVCTTCRPEDSHTSCTNSAIQRGSHAKTEVRRAKYGWGLFAAEDIRQDQLITTYTGQLYTPDTLASRYILFRYPQRNYNFGFGKHIDIEGASSGNESRFINDPRPNFNNLNCVASNTWVLGDPHLAIVAIKDIRRGQELFLKYGDDFWAATAKDT